MILCIQFLLYVSVFIIIIQKALTLHNRVKYPMELPLMKVIQSIDAIVLNKYYPSQILIQLMTYNVTKPLHIINFLPPMIVKYYQKVVL